jgi:hypothetical protein
MEILIKWAMAVSIFFATLQMLATGAGSLDTEAETVESNSRSESVKDKATCSRLRLSAPVDSLTVNKARIKAAAEVN